MKEESDDFEFEDKEQEEQAVYIKYDIASYPSDLTLSVLKEMWETGAVVIPEYQRNFVWSKKQASLLIDSFLCGLPVPPVFFYVSQDNKNLVIDGQQRIHSVIYYLDGFFGDEDTQSKKQVFRLDLSEKHPYNGKAFADLDPSDQRKLLHSSVLRAINIRQISPADQGTSAYHIFERLNTGGTPLAPQEIRNCVFRGDFSKQLRDLNLNENWRQILGKKYPDKRQKDVELLLRLFAITTALDNYEKPMKEFLNREMKRHATGTNRAVAVFSKNFQSATQTVISKLGEKPFHLHGPLNTSALDAVMVTLIKNIENVPDDLSQRYSKLKSSEEFKKVTSVATTDVLTMKDRFSLSQKILIG